MLPSIAILFSSVNGEEASPFEVLWLEKVGSANGTILCY
jgi:hypothetical protein